MELPHDPAIPPPGIQPREMKPVHQRDSSTPRFNAALFTIAKVRTQPMCPSASEQVKKKYCIHIMDSFSAPRE